MATKKSTTKKAGTAKSTKAVKPKKAAPAKATRVVSTSANGEAKTKKLSAIDAAAQVLGESGKPMNCQELIAAMASRGLWTSPAGRTPASTLYSSVIREIATKGNESRFQKAERGKFTANG